MAEMENWIENISEPKKLILAWQAPDHMKDRFRWAVGLLERSDGRETMRYLDPGVEFEAFNQGRTFEQARSLGYDGYPAFTLRRHLHDEGVISTFLRRLPPRNRADFDHYMRQFRFPVGSNPTDFALLGYTEAKLPSDGFSLVDPLDPGVNACELMLEVAGYRYYVAGNPIGIGIDHPVDLRAEPHNPHDAGAVSVHVGDRKIGNINRLQAPTFLAWLKARRISGTIQRLNGKPDHPRAFLFIRVMPTAKQIAA